MALGKAFSIEVQGLRELREGLLELPKATGTNVLKRTLLKAGEPIADAAQQLAPVLTGKLQRSVSVGTKLSRRQKTLHKKESRVEVFIGPGALAAAVTQEFGTVFHRPQPFMRPAWAANKFKALDIIKKDLGQEIDKARARIARKTARLAAKG